MIEAYKEGLELLDIGQGLMAAKKFNEAEILYPQSIWAPRSSLMSAYSYYYFDSYNDAIQEIDRYLKKYPNHQNKEYAFYLKSISYYNQISNEKKKLHYKYVPTINFTLSYIFAWSFFCFKSMG